VELPRESGGSVHSAVGDGSGDESFFDSDGSGSGRKRKRSVAERMLDLEAGESGVKRKRKSGRKPGPSRDAQYRNWVFTWNNYPADAREILKDDFEKKSKCTFYAYKPEISASGTRHLQGVIFFKCARSLGGVRKLACGKAHWERMQGTADEAVGYVEKEATADPGAGFGLVSFGSRPSGRGNGQGSRSDLGAVGVAIKGGFSIREIFEEHPSTFLRYHCGIERAVNLYPKSRNSKTQVFWYYGGTGSGKSFEAKAFADSKGKIDEPSDDIVFYKDPSSKWWCGYHQQTTVIIDDYRCDFCTFASLLRLFDEYPMSIEMKGSSTQFNSSFIIVTAPRPPDEMWGHRTSEDLGQLMRRIDVIKRFEIVDGERVVTVVK